MAEADPFAEKARIEATNTPEQSAPSRMQMVRGHARAAREKWRKTPLPLRILFYIAFAI